MDLSRRGFLLSPVAAAAGCAATRLVRPPPRWEGPATVGIALVAPAEPSPLTAFRQAAVAVGAALSLGPRKGERRVVLVKPAVNSNDPYPATASPESVAAAVALCREYDPEAQIVVADSSGALSRGDAFECMKRNGILDAAQRAGAGAPGFDVRPFERDGWVGVRPATAHHWKRGFAVPRLWDRVTDIVLVSRVSSHVLAGHTIAIKNFVGCVAPIDRWAFHWAAGFAPKMDEMIAELCLPFADRLRLVLVDARLAQADFGPYFGRVVTPGVVYATRDVVSADVFGLALLRLASRQAPPHRRSDRLSVRGPWATGQVRHAVELGLGPRSPGALKLAGVEAFDLRYREALWEALTDRRARLPTRF
jgi:uncharacterized protein (DUF362 family)